MILKCKVSFGNFQPGDEVEVPDGVVFDPGHFEAKDEPVKPVKKAPAKENE